MPLSFSDRTSTWYVGNASLILAKGTREQHPMKLKLSEYHSFSPEQAQNIDTTTDFTLYELLSYLTEIRAVPVHIENDTLIIDHPHAY